MDIIILRRWLTVRGDELGADYQGHDDLIRGHIYDVPESGRFTAGSRYSARLNSGIGREGQKRDKRAEIALTSRSADGSSGRVAMSEAILWEAIATGKRANLAASCHGSRSSRASAETALSSLPFLPSPTGANGNASNSDPSREAETDRDIALTECFHMDGG
jgi:hypothetical protein